MKNCMKDLIYKTDLIYMLKLFHSNGMKLTEIGHRLGLSQNNSVQWISTDRCSPSHKRAIEVKDKILEDVVLCDMVVNDILTSANKAKEYLNYILLTEDRIMNCIELTIKTSDDHHVLFKNSIIPLELKDKLINCGYSISEEQNEIIISWEPSYKFDDNSFSTQKDAEEYRSKNIINGKVIPWDNTYKILTRVK